MTSALTSGGIPTTASEWTVIRDKIEFTARSPYSAKDRRVLWCQGLIVCLSGMLYVATLIRRASGHHGLWCIRKDAEGYWRPNVHFAIPLVTIVYAVAQSTAIGLILLGSLTDVKVECVVALNLVACSTLYLGGWTKTWAVLYALPSSIFRLHRRDVLGSTARITRPRVFSPKVFNWVILIGYLAGLLPIPWLCFTVYWVHKINQRLSSFNVIVDDLITHLAAVPQDVGASLLLAVRTGHELLDLQDAQNQTLNNLRIFSGIWFLVSFTALIIFLSASFALLLAFTRQIEILGRIQREREALVTGRGSILSTKTSDLQPKTRPETQPHQPISPSRTSNKLFHRISVWLPSLETDDDESPLDRPSNHNRPGFDRRASNLGRQMWLAGNEGNLRQKVGEIDRWDGGRKGDELARKTRKRMVEYCVRYTWQTIFCTLIATSYIVLNIFIVCNVLDAPRSISLSQLFRTIEQWAAWSWGGGPGAILGLLACIVAFSRNPSLPREPAQGPHTSREEIDDQDQDPENPELDPNSGLPDPNALTFEKLQHHSHSESYKSSPKSRTKLSKSSLSGPDQSRGQWRLPLTTLERSHFSNTTKSKEPSLSSEISSNLSQGWSPFQVSLNTATLVTRSPARQYPVSDLYQNRSESEDAISLPPKASYSYHSSRSNSLSRARLEPPIPLYPLPVQVPRSEGQEFIYSPPQSPNRQFPESTDLGHFDTIHRLREQR